MQSQYSFVKGAITNTLKKHSSLIRIAMLATLEVGITMTTVAEREASSPMIVKHFKPISVCLDCHNCARGMRLARRQNKQSADPGQHLSAVKKLF